MSLGFGATFVNPRHWSDPFICHCENHQHEGDHSLGLAQKIVAIAIAVLTAAPLLFVFPPLLGIPSFFAFGILVFYTTCALLKARNVVLLDYRTANPEVSWNFFSPVYWGVRHSRIDRGGLAGVDPFRGGDSFDRRRPAHGMGGHVPVGDTRIPGIPARDPGRPARDPGRPARDPGIAARDFGRPAHNPGISTRDIGRLVSSAFSRGPVEGLRVSVGGRDR